MTSTKWRVVLSGHLNGAHNMAIDEAILRSVAEGGPPTLRFYGWEPPAISLGYFQKVDEELDLEACRSLGVDVVRRPTGGRAVLHDVEVTYSLVVPENYELIPKGITESYREISQGMVLGLSKLGLHAQMVSLGRKRSSAGTGQGRSNTANRSVSESERNPGSKKYNITVELPDQRSTSVVCFDAPSWYEVAVDGKKIIGSAQMRRSGVLLQHGSIPLELDADKLFSCLRLPSARVRERLKQSFLDKATSVRAALGRTVSFMEVSDVIRDGISEYLNVDMVEGGLTDAEVKQSEELLVTKYGESPEHVFHSGKTTKAGSV